MVVNYGNLPLGQVLKLLVSIIGRDTVMAIADEQKITIDLDRIFDEKEGSFIHLRFSENNSLMELIRNFFQLIEKPTINEMKRKPLINRDKSNSSEENDYKIPHRIISSVILSFFYIYRKALRTVTPYEMKTQHIVLHLLKWSLGYLGEKIQDSENLYTITKDFVRQLLDDTYENIFHKIIVNDDFYKQLKKFYEKKHPNSKNSPNFKQSIKRYCNNSSNPTWKTIKPILDFVYSKIEKELAHHLFYFYLIKNIKTALKDICDIEIEDIYQIKQDVRLRTDDKLPSEPQSESQCFLNLCDLSLLQKYFIDPDFYEQRKAIFQDCGSYLWGKTVVELDKAEKLIQAIEEKCPHCGIFFASWARARLAVLSCKLDDSEEDKKLQIEALEKYHTAFDKGRNFAGASLKGFLEESIAATVYLNRRETKDIPKVIDSDKSLKTPITDDVKGSERRDASYGAKQYYEYGYALDLYEQDSSETFFLHFHAEENFWGVFSPSLFIHSETAMNRYIEDMLKANGVFHAEEGLEQYNESLKEKLDNIVKKEKNINRRMEVQPGHNVQYTPLSIALQRGMLDIAEKYLNDSKNLDVNVINTHGSTALEEALTMYKKHRFSGGDEQKEKRYKKIIMELIERSTLNSLYAETKKKYISVLEEAINTFDFDIVKAIVETKGFDIHKRISADELSPLYYAIQRCYFVSSLNSTGELSISSMKNINYTKLDVPGIFTEYRKANFENMTCDPLWKEQEKQINYMFCGKPEIWEQELSELKEIVKYLADKTDNVDTFAKKAPNGDCTTALSLTVECGFDDICRLLIEKGANPARIFSNNGIPYDSPFIRAAWFKSFKILEMLLTDFQEKIKPIINERYREERQTAAHLLFKVDYGNYIYQYSVNNENFKFIEQFIPLFRKVGAEFDIPDISNTTVRQILRKNDIEYLIK